MEHTNINTEQDINKNNITIIDVVSANKSIEICLNILNSVDWDVVDLLINETPPELQNEYNYKVLSATRKFQEELKNYE